MAEAKKTVIVASNFPMALQASTAQPKPATPNDPPPVPAGPPPEAIKTADISGERATETVGGYGITRDVDPEVVEKYLAAHPEMKEFIKVVSEDDLKKMQEDAASQYGFEVGLKLAAEEASKTAPPPARTHAPPPAPPHKGA